MKAAVVREFGKSLVIEEVPVPQPGPGQVLIKYGATGGCHTDLHAANGDWPVRPNPPFIPGHEGVAYVANCFILRPFWIPSSAKPTGDPIKLARSSLYRKNLQPIASHRFAAFPNRRPLRRPDRHPLRS